MGIAGIKQRNARRTQSDRRVAAQQTLLEAAVRLIADKGVGRTSLAEIAAFTGFNKAHASHYFKNRTGLLKAVIAHIDSQMNQRIAQGRRAEPGLDTIIKLIEVSFSPEILELVKAFVLIQKEALIHGSELGPFVRQYNRALIERLAAEIRIGADNGEFAGSTNPRVRAALLIAAIRGICMQWALNPSVLDLSRLQPMAIEFVRRSLANA